MTEAELREVVKAYGTPTYVFDEEAFRARIRTVREAFGPDVALCYSIKANPFLVPAAREEGMLLEVCSPGELAICEHEGIEASRIVYSGVCKQEDDVREALRYGVGVFTAESPLQLELVNREALAAGRRVPVLLRLSGKSQFGMIKADLMTLVAKRDAFAGVELVGIHYFVGTQRRKLKRQRAELTMLLKLADELEDTYGWRPARLEYGPGLGFPYFTDEDFSDTLAPAFELAGDLREVAQHVELTVEMGRFFTSECGSYLTRVVDLKAGFDLPYAFVDGGINHVNYLGQMMGMRQPQIRNLSAGDGASRELATWSLCGSLCTTADVLVREIELALAPGDVLAFDNIGAYSVTEGVYLFLSRTMPRIVLHREDGFVLARDFVETSALNVAGSSRG